MEIIDGEQVATNKKTGAKVVLRDGAWVPYAPKAAPSPAPAAPGAAPPEQPDLAARLSGAASRGAGKLGSMISPTVGKAAEAVTGFVLPQSNIQAGIDAAILASYGTGIGEAGTLGELAGKGIEYLPRFARPAMRLAGRLAIPAAGGAIGGATEGKPGTGAAIGAGEGLLGEATAGLTATGKRSIQQLDVNRIGKWIGDRLPIRRPLVVEDLDKLFRGGDATRQAGKTLEGTYDTIRSALGNAQLQIPSPAGSQQQPISASLDEINDLIGRVENHGYNLSGDPRTAMAGKAMRAAAHQMVEDTAMALEQFQKGLGSQYFKARRDFATTQLMKRIFNESFDKESGEFSMQKLQQVVSRAGNEGYRDDLNNLLGPQGADSFLDAVFRGAKPTAVDVPGHGPAGRAYVHGGLEPRFSLHMPSIPKHVGNLPMDLGRGRALAAGLTLGPARLATLLGNYFGGEPAPAGATP